MKRRSLGGLALLLAAASACGPTEPSPSPSPSTSPTPNACSTAPSAYAKAVVDSWIPACSLAQNVYNDPQKALGPEDAAGNGPVSYTGFVSLGFGGRVTVDLGGCITDRPGPDLRIFQAVSSEPVSVYVSLSPTGPFTLIEARKAVRRADQRRQGLLRRRPRVGGRDPGALRAGRGRRALPLPRRHRERGRRPRRGAGARRRHRGRSRLLPLSPARQRLWVSPASSSPRSRQAAAWLESADSTRRSWRIARAAMPPRRYQEASA